MAGRCSLQYLLFTVVTTLLMLLSSTPPSTARRIPSKGVRGAYWPSWRRQSFPPSSIDPSLFTHVFYAFVLPDPSSYHLVITPNDDRDLPVFTATLHDHKPPLQALLSIGGGNDRATAAFSRMASDPSTRSAFINSSIAVARRYGLDGLDLDWESPADTKQMGDFASLIREWRAAVEQDARRSRRPRLLLTSAVYFAAHFFSYGAARSFPTAALRDAVDFVNVMCYDYRGSWDTSTTGAHAALYDPNSNFSTSYGIGSWLAAGMPREKVVMGLPLYGKSWTLRDPAGHGIGAPAVGTGPGDDGILTYSEVVDQNAASGATEVYDGATVSTYSYAGRVWVGYDDPRSAAAKVEYARGLHLGGYFFWALSYDKDWSISRADSSAARGGIFAIHAMVGLFKM
ncbi:hypothetical protein Taro_003498 [Colocasia esculenta]|uniref:GH18 domain-containing protein n=1 Tax=Colocasia esculenta TaxID=4460 RepID=A0A843TJG8_COLES|nr:hypothetical protein [Colocasia esculenta]